MKNLASRLADLADDADRLGLKTAADELDGLLRGLDAQDSELVTQLSQDDIDAARAGDKITHITQKFAVEIVNKLFGFENKQEGRAMLFDGKDDVPGLGMRDHYDVKELFDWLDP
jgi:hypothetical protein